MSPGRLPPEVWHYIGMTTSGLRASMTLTARTDDGLIRRGDGHGPWDPLWPEDGPVPVWFRVSEAVAREYAPTARRLPRI